MIHDNQSQDNDTLGALWQQQTTITIDTDKIKRLAKSQQRKQRCYLAVDVCSLLFAWILLFLDLSFTAFVKGFIVFNALMVTALVLMLLKLRWVSLFHINDSTSEYHARLLKQLRNNARIAFYNKHSTWFVFVILIVFLFINSLLEGDTLSPILMHYAYLGGLSLVFFVPWYIWAHKRQHRFEAEANNIQALINNSPTQHHQNK